MRRGRQGPLKREHDSSNPSFLVFSLSVSVQQILDRIVDAVGTDALERWHKWFNRCSCRQSNGYGIAIEMCIVDCSLSDA